MKRYIPYNSIFVTILLITGIVSCVKVDVFNTPHPEKGAVVLTVDWSERGKEVPAPTAYTVVTDSKTYSLTALTNDLGIFDPVEQSIYIHTNTTNGISVNGTVATVEVLPDGTLYPHPDWLLTYSGSFTPVADDIIHVTAITTQQIRQLTLVLQHEGSLSNQIESITATLSGVVRTIDISNSSYGTLAEVGLMFERPDVAGDPVARTATVRLLGVGGVEQLLTGTITIDTGEMVEIPFVSDLTAGLSAFNTGKNLPLVLEAKIIVEPDHNVEAGFSATIKSWETGGNGSGTAN